MGVPASRSDEEEQPYNSFANYLLSRLCPKRQTQVYNVSIIQSGGGTCIPCTIPSHPPLAPTFSHAIWSYVSTIRASCLVVQASNHNHICMCGAKERGNDNQPAKTHPLSLFPYLEATTINTMTTYTSPSLYSCSCHATALALQCFLIPVRTATANAKWLGNRIRKKLSPGKRIIRSRGGGALARSKSGAFQMIIYSTLT